jgi:hypothetical protein
MKARDIAGAVACGLLLGLLVCAGLYFSITGSP